MFRKCIATGALFLLAGVAPAGAQTAGTPNTLVLPLRTLGVSDQTAIVSRELLAGSLGDLGLPVIAAAPDAAPLPAGASGCDDAACAIALGRSLGASQVVYGTMSRLGAKIIVRVSVVRTDADAPHYRDQLTATSEEEMDTLMRRFAEGIVAGRPNSDRATIESVTEAETLLPPRRASRGSFGLRAGFLFPTGEGFGGSDRLSHLQAAYRYDLKDVFVETTPLLGFSFGDGELDWTLLDVSVTRPFGGGDFTPYLGGGLGVHSVTVSRPQTIVYSYPGQPDQVYTYDVKVTETAPSLDLVAGVLALRTYDFSLIVELRYHHVFVDPDKLGGGGAQGIRLTFGTSR